MALMFSITLEGVEEARFSLLRFRDTAMDFREPFREIANDIWGLMRRQMQSQGQFRSGGWQRLAPATIERKHRQALDMRILYAKHRLWRSVASGYAGRDSVRRIQKQSMFVGTRVPYAKYHHSKAPRRHLPRRPLIELNSDDNLRFARLLQAHIQTKAGFVSSTRRI